MIIKAEQKRIPTRRYMNQEEERQFADRLEEMFFRAAAEKRGIYREDRDELCKEFAVSKGVFENRLGKMRKEKNIDLPRCCKKYPVQPRQKRGGNGKTTSETITVKWQPEAEEAEEDQDDVKYLLSLVEQKDKEIAELKESLTQKQAEIDQVVEDNIQLRGMIDAAHKLRAEMHNSHQAEIKKNSGIIQQLSGELHTVKQGLTQLRKEKTQASQKAYFKGRNDVKENEMMKWIEKGVDLGWEKGLKAGMFVSETHSRGGAVNILRNIFESAVERKNLGDSPEAA